MQRIHHLADRLPALEWYRGGGPELTAAQVAAYTLLLLASLAQTVPAFYGVLQFDRLLRLYGAGEMRMRLNDLADQVGITPQNLSKLKTGRARAVGFSTLEAICTALDCQPGHLLGYVPDDEACREGGWLQEVGPALHQASEPLQTSSRTGAP